MLVFFMKEREIYTKLLSPQRFHSKVLRSIIYQIYHLLINIKLFLLPISLHLIFYVDLLYLLYSR